MKQRMKTNDIVNIYTMLSGAKFDTLSAEDQIRVWKIGRALKPAFVEFNDAKNDAFAKFLPDAQKLYSRIDAYRKALKAGEKTEITYDEFRADLKAVNHGEEQVGAAMDSILQKEVDVEFEPLSEDTLMLLKAENSWTLGQAMALELIVKD